MQAQFYKISSSLNQKMKCKAQCFTKVQDSLRKYRKVFLSDVYFYLVSEEKVKYRISILKIKKIVVSNNSSEFVILTEGKSVLVDSLAIRGTFLKQVRKINEDLDIVHVKEPLLDEYVQNKKGGEVKQDSLLLNLNRLKNAYTQFGPDPFKKKFDELYKIQQIIGKDHDHSLVVVSETKLREELLKKKKKKEVQATKYTVKIYPKQPLGKDKELLKRILNEKRSLQEVMSPYFPILHRCMISKTYAYCLTEFYKGEPLQHYISNETLNKHTLKNLFGQIAVGIGQLHQCNLIYNNVNLKSIFVTDQGFVIFNDMTLCKKIQNFRKTTTIHENQKDLKEEIQKEKQAQVSEDSPEYDWFCFGKLIFQIKEGKKYQSGLTISEYKEKELTHLVCELLDKIPSNRLGFKNDYYEVLGHQYFKGVNKKELATQTCQPLKKFFQINHSNFSKQNLSSLLEGEDWSVYDDLLRDYEYCRELED